MPSHTPETMEKPGHSSHCRCSVCDCTHSHRPMLISLCDVYFEREGHRILSDINLTVDRGDFMAITGPNGGGKTTMLRLILGLLKPTSGKSSTTMNMANRRHIPGSAICLRKTALTHISLLRYAKWSNRPCCPTPPSPQPKNANEWTQPSKK